jgi:hypothetical protein
MKEFENLNTLTVDLGQFLLLSVAEYLDEYRPNCFSMIFFDRQ